MKRRFFLGTILSGAVILVGRTLPAAEMPRRGLKVVVAGDAATEVRQAAQKLLTAVPKHPLLSILAGDAPPVRLTDSGQLARGPAAARAYDHMVLVGEPDDPMVKAAWQREARTDATAWYLFGFGHLQGELGYIESDRNPFLHAAAIPQAPYETEVITLTGSTPRGVALAIAAFLERGLINGVVAAPGWRRPKHSLLERDPLTPDFSLRAQAPQQAGPLRQIGLTQASEDEYRGVFDDTGVMPRVIWRWKYYRDGVWDGAGAARAFDHYAAGLHRRAYGNTLWAAQFASTAQAGEAAVKIAAAAKLSGRGDLWEGEQPPYGSEKNRPGPLILWQRGTWLLMSTLPGEADEALRQDWKVEGE
jgi:hypothetical protein